MPNQIIGHPLTKLRNYSYFEGLPASLPPPVIVEKHPGLFAPALAHEVRNPLSNINLAVEMLQSMVSNEEQKLYLDIITRASGRIDHLINDLLIYQQAGDLVPERTSLQDLLDKVILGTADRLMLKNVMVTKNYTASDCNVLVDKQKIKIALTNIVINAIDAMPVKNGHLQLSVKAVNDKCIIELEDNGIGISHENLQNIFKPYFTRKSNGMGLGLSTTLETLLSNRARVAVQSEEGMGTRFIISFDSIQHAEKYDGHKPQLIAV